MNVAKARAELEDEDWLEDCDSLNEAYRAGADAAMTLARAQIEQWVSDNGFDTDYYGADAIGVGL